MTHAPMKYLEVFNDQFMNMVKDIAKAFPSDQVLRSYPLVVRGLLLANDKAIHEVFHSRIAVTYRSQIQKEDESFFLDKSYDEYDDTCASDVREGFVSWLKNCWQSLNDVNKKMMWKYFHLLLALDDKLGSGGLANGANGTKPRGAN